MGPTLKVEAGLCWLSVLDRAWGQGREKNRGGGRSRQWGGEGLVGRGKLRNWEDGLAEVAEPAMQLS